MKQEKKEIRPEKIAQKVIIYFNYVSQGYSNSMARSMADIRIWEHEWLMDTSPEYIRIHISKRQGNARGKDHEKQIKRLYELENPQPKVAFTSENCELLLPRGLL